jgi:hypothetical protein
MSPNEARQVEDNSAYTGGDTYYMPSNYGKIAEDGSIQTTAAPKTGVNNASNTPA